MGIPLGRRPVSRTVGVYRSGRRPQANGAGCWDGRLVVHLTTDPVEDAEGALKVPDTGTAAEDLRQHLHMLADFLTEAPAGKVMLALIGQAQHDSAIAAVFQRRYLDDRRALDRAILERGVARGDVRDDVDLDLVIDVLYGPIYPRVLLTGLPIDSKFIDALVDQVFSPPAGLDVRRPPPRQHQRRESRRAIAASDT
jgi:hypothetical protein